MAEIIEKNTEKVSDSQKNFVPLQHNNKTMKDYGTGNNRRAEAAADGHDADHRHERLGVHAVQTRGVPSLGSRWDIELYEEGLPSGSADDRLGNARAEIQGESDRLIAVAKQIGDYIPSTIWDTFGYREKKPSGESIVFLDERNNRVVKFKDPFAYVSLKNDNPYHALYEHHIHNHFFSDAGYRFLGVSQDPVSGGVHFAFEQPFIFADKTPSQDEIKDWFKKRGFELSPDGYWFSDGYVSFTDVWGDNCIKDDQGELHFIDPIIKFEQDPKEVIAHYLERTESVRKKLDQAGITVGSRFRVERLNSFNDFRVKAIDLPGNKVVFSHLTSHPDYQYDFDWPIERFLDNIKLYQGSRWIQIDEDRHDIVIPEAQKAILVRAKDPSPRAAFTDAQVLALNRYKTLFNEKVSGEEILSGLVDSLYSKLRSEKIPDAWIKDVRQEIIDLANGHRRDVDQGLRR